MSSSSGITSPVQGAIKGNQGNGGQLAQIIKLPATLQNNPKAVRLEGQVVSQNTQNNTATVKTEYGDIQIRIKGNRQPQNGQRVELDIPAGRPPQKAEVRAAPQQNTAQNTGQTTQTNTQTQNTSVQPNRVDVQPIKTGQPSQSNASAPPQQQQAVNIKQALPTVIQEALTTARPVTQTSQAPQILAPDVTVRLISVPPATANNIVQQFIQSLPPPTQSSSGQNALAQNISAALPPTTPSLSPPVLNATSSTLTLPSTTIQSALVTNTAIQTPIGLNLTTPQTVTTTLNSLNLNTAQTLQTNQVLNPSFANQIIGQLNGQVSTSAQPAPSSASLSVQNAGLQNTQTLSATPLNFDPNNPTLQTSSRVPQIDIQVIKVTPPNVALTVPPENGIAPKAVPALTQFPALTAGTNTATSVTAQVTGFTNGNLPLLTIQGVGGQLTQSFVLQNPNTNLQLGSQLQIIPKGTAPLVALPPLAMKGLANPLLQGFQWQAIDDLYQALQTSSPAQAASLGRSLPNAGTPSQLGAAGLMFIAAVKSGNFDMVLGDKKIDLLQRIGRGGTMDSLTQAPRAGGAEPAVQSDWRAVPLPMFWENEIHKITLFTRKEGDDGQKENQNNGSTRFIFDLSLTRMGDIQIDGLIKESRLDLVLRTENSFSEPMQQTMRQAYSAALGHTDLTGDLKFQGSTDNWIHVLEQETQLGVSI